MILTSKTLREITKATITTIIDNYSDTLLPSDEKVERPPLVRGALRMPPLLAEHGFSVLVEVWDDSKHHTILMDFGASKIGVPYNVKVLEIDLEKVEAFVISHGHHDHVGSISEILYQLSKKPRPVVVHPDAFIPTRFRTLPEGKEIPIPCLEKGVIEQSGNEVIDGRSLVLTASDHILVLGEIPRTNDFEKVSGAYYREGEKICKDRIMDDKAIVINVKNKGLVIISGCAHAGIMNTIRYAQKLVGVDKLYCVMGGFHLVDSDEDKVKRTLKEMKLLDPEIIVPCHCTGIKVKQKFEKRFPRAFVWNSSGTRIHL